MADSERPAEYCKKQWLQLEANGREYVQTMCLFLILPLTSYYLLPATIYSLLASQSASQPARRSRQQRVTKLALLFHLTGITLIMIIIIFIWPTIRHLSYQATVASRHFALVPIVSRPLAVAAHWASPSCSPFVTWPRLSRAQLVVYILHYILLQISPKKNCTHSSLLARMKKHWTRLEFSSQFELSLNP